MSTSLTLTPLPDYAAVRVELDDAPNGEAVILRTDANGTRAVRQAAGTVVSAGVLQLVDYEPALTGAVSYAYAAATRTNVLANPSFDADTSGWALSGATLTRTAAGGSDGGAYLAVTNAPASGVLYSTPAGTPAAAGQTWTASAWVRGVAGQKLQVVVGPYTSGGVALLGTRVTVTLTGAWQRISATQVLPATTGLVRLWIIAQHAAQAFDVDQAMLERSPALGSYIAGTVTSGTSASTSLAGVLDGPVVASVVHPGQRRDLAGLQTYREQRTGGPTVHTPIGRDGDPVVLLRRSGPRTAEAGLYARTYEEAQGIEATVSAGDVILFRQLDFPGMDAYGVVTGTSVQTWHVDELEEVDWLVTVSYLEVPAPGDALAGGAVWTYADLAALGVTYDQLRGLFATYYALAVGT